MSTTSLRCEHCDTEAQVIDPDGADDVGDLLHDWSVEHADCGKPPTETAWRQLMNHGQAATLVEHGGDASLVIPFPRPSWSDRERDMVGASVLGSCYRSGKVAVASTHSTGWDNDDEYCAARILVSAKLFGNGVRSVGVSMVKKGLSEPAGMSLTIAEARQLAEVLTAACELVETE